MTKKALTFFFISIIALLSPYIGHAGFLVRAHAPLAAVAKTEDALSDLPGKGGHGHFGGHFHAPHGGGHWHGIAGHYHAHSYHPHNYHIYYHPHYAHYSRNYGHSNGNTGSILGTASLVFAAITPLTLLAFGSLPAIICSAGGVLTGGLGLAADKNKKPARVGLAISIIECAALATLYALYIL